MLKVVGIKDARETVSKKSGRKLDSYMVWIAGPGHDVVGQECNVEFVQASIFEGAAKGRQLEQLVGKECKVSYDRRGFVTDFSIVL